MKIEVILQNTVELPDFLSRHEFQLWVDTVLKRIQNSMPQNVNEVTIRLVDREEGAALNERYRKGSGPTNVLSFPNEPDSSEHNESLGDIAICAELVDEEAVEQGIPPKNHWAHLTVHGILHLLGFDHGNEADAIMMENLEVQILQDLGIENPYEEPDIS